jgi:hypothetical protein
MGIDSAQGDYAADEILSVFVAGPDNKGYYPYYGKEKFQLITSVTGQNAIANRSDFTPKHIPVETEEHFHEVSVTDTERAVGAFMPVGADTIKMQLLRSQLDLEKEAGQLAMIADTTKYASGFTLDASANTNLHRFSNPNADPVNDITDWIEVVRKGCRQIPDTVATSWGPIVKLRRHPAIRDAIKYGGTADKPAAMVSLAALSELFGIRFVIGSAGWASPFGAALDDIWASRTTAAGAIFWVGCTGAGRVLAQRFGITVSKAGFPKFSPYIDPRVSSTQATVYKYALAWKPHLVDNVGDGTSNAAFLVTKVI